MFKTVETNKTLKLSCLPRVYPPLPFFKTLHLCNPVRLIYFYVSRWICFVFFWNFLSYYYYFWFYPENIFSAVEYFCKYFFLLSFYVRAAHPLANRGASCTVDWKDARHLAQTPWLLAVGWHRDVSFARCRNTQLGVWKKLCKWFWWRCEMMLSNKNFVAEELCKSPFSL